MRGIAIARRFEQAVVFATRHANRPIRPERIADEAGVVGEQRFHRSRVGVDRRLRDEARRRQLVAGPKGRPPLLARRSPTRRRRTPTRRGTGRRPATSASGRAAWAARRWGRRRRSGAAGSGAADCRSRGTCVVGRAVARLAGDAELGGGRRGRPASRAAASRTACRTAACRASRDRRYRCCSSGRSPRAVACVGGCSTAMRRGIQRCS